MKTLKKYGALALIVSLILASVFVFSAVSAAAATENYTEYTETASHNSHLKVEPTAILEVNSADVLANIAAPVDPITPTVAIFTVDKDMKVSIGEEKQDFTTVFNTYLKGNVIPALKISDMDTANAFIAYMKNTYYIQDITIVSDQIDVIEKIYTDETCYVVNSVYDLTKLALPSNRYEFFRYIGEANAAGCNILMVNGRDANASEIAKYTAALSKVCWGRVDGKDAVTDVVGAVAAGCHGVVADNFTSLVRGIEKFKENGFARAQFIAAHRGITAYANENSLTALSAAANEGATHVEVDLQVTADGEIVLCHNSDAGATSTADAKTWVANQNSADLRKHTLNDYSELYGETFPTLDEVIHCLIDTDVIFIFELKLDNGSATAVTKLKGVEKMYSIISNYEAMQGRWMTITFFAPYAEQMKQISPDIPVGFLGNAKADNGVTWKNVPENEDITQIAQFIPFLRKYNVLLDMTNNSSTAKMIDAYLSRGYVINTWTFSDPSHFAIGANIATTDAAEMCAMMVNEVAIENNIQLTAADLTSGTAVVKCRTYNGWVEELRCKILLIERSEDEKTAKVVFFYIQEGDVPYGIYSNLTSVRIA